MRSPKPTQSRKGGGPDGVDLLDALQWFQKELDGSIRLTVMVAPGNWNQPTLKGVWQLYRVIEGKVWVLAERTFYWPNNEGRDFLATQQIELHRAYHKWGDLVY